MCFYTHFDILKSKFSFFFIIKFGSVRSGSWEKISNTEVITTPISTVVDMGVEVAEFPTQAFSSVMGKNGGHTFFPSSSVSGGCGEGGGEGPETLSAGGKRETIETRIYFSLRTAFF